jgi:hypothetical protein
MTADRLDSIAPNWGSQAGRGREGDFTLVEHPEHGKRGLAVRRVNEKERKNVWRRGGFLFATEAEAWTFAEDELIFDGDGPRHVRQTFSHQKVGGLRIYINMGSTGAF